VKALGFESVSKTYSIYASPGDRLRELASFRKPAHHQDFWALRDISFTVERGEVFCVIGENGAGKSTLLQLVAGILHPTAGSVTTSGRVSALLELGAGFDTEFSGRDNVYLNGAISGFSAREIDAKFRHIQDFAELGEFMNRPLKTYSSGMVVRLAFAVAIHADPEILLVDEALSVGDVYFRQKCMRKVHELRSRGVTILFVSHALADVSAIGDRTLWLDHGRIRELGDTETVVERYLEAMARKDAAYVQSRRSLNREEAPPVSPVPVDHLPNVDHRSGDGRARVTGIALLDEAGEPLVQLQPSSRLIVRIAVRACAPIQRPVIGFMLRNHLGIDFSATDTLRENIGLPELREGEILAVDFHLDLPELYPAVFSFSPAVADGIFEQSAMCDWIDNAITIQMATGTEQVYGYTHVPCRIELNTRLSGPASIVEANP
jgi:ABC-type polysaccharide/polyol phosphate transport system ATPase subunit